MPEIDNNPSAQLYRLVASPLDDDKVLVLKSEVIPNVPPDVNQPVEPFMFLEREDAISFATAIMDNMELAYHTLCKHKNKVINLAEDIANGSIYTVNYRFSPTEGDVDILVIMNEIPMFIASLLIVADSDLVDVEELDKKFSTLLQSFGPTISEIVQHFKAQG